MNLKSSDIDGIGKKLDELIEVVNGGRGSGNFNPGQGRGIGKPGNGMSTKSDKMLHDTVKQMADIFSTMNKREGYKYSSSEDLVLKQGKFFTPEKRPDGIELGPKKECFANAAKLALERSNLTYVEGYAMVNDRLPLPIAHAWCVDKKGRVIDNTWENPGVSYFGVPFKTSYLAKKLSETGVYGILSGSVGSSDFLKDGVPSEGIANIKKQKNAIVLNGGEGSGNFGHKGRVGKVGGSSKDGSGSKAEFSEMLSKDAKEVLGEINEYSEGAYFKEINSVLDDFSKLGVDVKKVKFETNVDKLPEKMKKQVTDSTEGMISAKKNLEAVIYLDETKQSEYGLGGENKFLEGREPKDQPWATNNSPIGILRHELGHLAAYTVFMNSRGRKGTAGPILGGAVNLETHANFKKIFGEGYALNRLKLSRYGMKDSGEAVAESFANPNFSSDTKKIYDFYINELKKKVQNNAVEDDGWLVLCLGFTTKDPLSNKVNKLIHKINEVTGKRGNPYHDEKGRFTFAPYQKYPLMEESVKKLAALYKNRRDIYDSGFYDAVYAERTKLHQEYSSAEEMKKSDKAIEDWVHGDVLEDKEGAHFSDIDVALSKSLTREFHNQQTVYRGQYDSDTVDSKSITSWTPYEGMAVGFGKKAAQINDAEKVSLFKIKTTDKNVILSPEIIYSVDSVGDWRSQQEFIVQAPKTKAYHTEDVDSINPYKRYDVQNSYVWNNKDNGGGNPYHDEKGRFASGPSSSSKEGSKSSILEKGGIGEGYLGDTLDELDDAQLSKLAKNPIADLSDKRIREVASMRQKMYGTKEEFDLANQWLMSIVGNGADIMEKARTLKFNPSKEIELSRRIIGDKEVTLFRNQEGDFDKKKYKESRWGDIPHSHSSSGNDYTIKGNKNNILIHPEVLYSADIGDPFYRQEREYVVDNSKIEDVWRGIKL